MAEFKGTKLDDSQIRSDKLEKLLQNAGHIKKPILSAIELPAIAEDGEQVFVKGDKAVYVFDAQTASWSPINANRAETEATINELQSQIDSIKQAIDDDVDGTIVDTIQNLKTQWESADTDLQDLVGQKVDKTVYDVKVTEINNKVDGEIANRASGDAALQTSIDGEIVRAKAEELRIEGKVDSEITMRQQAFTSLDSRVTGVEDELLDAQASLAKSKSFTSVDARFEETEVDVKNEIARAKAEEARIEGKVDSEVTNRQQAITDLDNRLATEINSRSSADTALGARIDTVVTSVSNEETARIAADNSIKTRIDNVETTVANETSARISKDNELSGKISTVESVLEDAKSSTAKVVNGVPKAFTSLDARLEEIEVDVKGEIEARIADVDAETSRATSEEVRIEGKVDKEITDRATAVSGVQSNLDAYKTSTNTRLDGIDADVLEVQGNLDTEVTRATSEEARIEGKVNQEISDRQTAVTGVQSNLNTYKTSNDTRVGNVESDLAAEKTTRENADTNLQNQINTINSGKANAAGNTTQDFSAKNLTVAGDILPTGNSLQNIGSPTNRFKGLYVDEAYLSTNTLYIGDTPVMGTNADTIMIKADPDQSINMSTSGVGLTQITSVNGIEMSTSGMNGDIKVQAKGTGSRVVMSATNTVEMSAANVNIAGALDIKGATALDALTVRGNLTVQGTTTTVNSTSLSVKDNIIEVNQGEAGAGVTLGQAGLKVDRGDAADYFMVFDETDDMFKVGMAGQLETIASRPYVDQKASTVQTSLDNYKTSNDSRVSTAESNITSQGNRITSVEGEISTARGGAVNLDARLDEIDTAVAGKLGATANAVSASKLATARTFTLTGDVSGSVSFDGTANVSITATVADNSHAHTIANVTGLQTALDGKAASVHTHGIADVTGLQTALDGKSSTSHTHTLGVLTDTTITSPVSGNFLRHNGTAWVNTVLTAADIPNLDAAKITTGTIANARLTAGTTSVAGIVQLSSATNSTSTTLAATASAVKSAYDLASGKANSVHTHAIADVTDLQTALDGKSDATHTHALTNITDVTITSPTTGQRLEFDGTKWINSALSAAEIPNLDASKITTGTIANARLTAGTTSVAGIVQLSTATNSTSTTLAATASAVKSAYDLAASKASTAVATTTANGLMSSTDKTKLDGIQAGAISQATADGRYLQSAGGNMTGGITFGNKFKIEYNSTEDSLDILVV